MGVPTVRTVALRGCTLITQQSFLTLRSPITTLCGRLPRNWVGTLPFTLPSTLPSATLPFAQLHWLRCTLKIWAGLTALHPVS